MNTDKIVIYCDGGARGNPGPAGIGVVIKAPDGTTISTFNKKIGFATNNEAEYTAVLEAFNQLQALSILPDKEIYFYLDSALVVNQLTGKFRIKNSRLQNFVRQIKKVEKIINKQIIYRQIPREQNRLADQLVNQALDS